MRTTKQRFEIRQKRTRFTISKNSDRPRLSVFKSGKHIYAQLIDDSKGMTLAAASTLEKELNKGNKSHSNKITADLVGKLIGKRAKEVGIKTVVFDKGGYKYHGVIKSLADAAREFLDF